MILLELLKAAAWGIVEGITEWLPISSTGHMILLDELIRLNASDAFKEMFLVVIQLGAILAVVLLYFHRLNPFALQVRPRRSGYPAHLAPGHCGRPARRRSGLSIWTTGLTNICITI
jgi:undecaprenyl pyrophosphate phosphatase UppP